MPLAPFEIAEVASWERDGCPGNRERIPGIEEILTGHCGTRSDSGIGCMLKLSPRDTKLSTAAALKPPEEVAPC